MDKVVTCHIDCYKANPEVLVEVPGVVTLMGAFSDFCKGHCITGTGALGLRVALSSREEMQVRVFDASRNDRKQFSLTALKYKKEDKWANYVKGVFSLLNAEGYDFSHGFDITLKGALLYCDKLTVSVAITLGLLLAIDNYCKLGLDKSAIIRLAYQACTRFSNVKCRMRDIITMMYAEKGKVLFFDLQTMAFEMAEYPFADASDSSSAYGLIVDPQVPPQILREELEEKREDAHSCCEALKAVLPGEYRLRTYPISELKSHAILNLSEHERRTCEYVIGETSYTLKAYKAMLAKDAKTFAKCLRSIYVSMRDVFEISCPEVDWLIKRAGETEGVYGASLISNGASGSIYLVLEKDGEESYKTNMEDYKRIFDFMPETRLFNPGGSARVIEEFKVE